MKNRERPRERANLHAIDCKQYAIDTVANEGIDLIFIGVAYASYTGSVLAALQLSQSQQVALKHEKVALNNICKTRSEKKY